MQDDVATKRAIDTYSVQDPSFGSTREAKFVLSITEAFEQGDSEMFTGAVAEFDRCVVIPLLYLFASMADPRCETINRLTKLDNWKTGILLAIKRQIAEEPSLT